MKQPDGRSVQTLRIPGLTDRGSEPYFHEPWQAKLFALTVALQDQNMFSWPDWTNSFAARLKVHSAPPTDSTTPEQAAHYYTVWLQTLEDILDNTGASNSKMVGKMAEQWKRAAKATPHGQPILFENGRDDFKI